MKHFRLSLLLSVVFSLSLHAQSVRQDSAGLNRELTLEREYNPVLEDASKINQLPEIKEPEAPKSRVEFSGYTFPLSLSPYLRTIRPGDYLTALAASKERGYLDAGLSFLMDIDGDFGYQLLNTNADDLNLYLSHRSGNSNIAFLQDGQKQKMKFNDNYGGFNFRHDFGKAQFNTHAQYTYSAYNYYGKTIPRPSFSEIIDFSDKSINQQNDLMEIHAGIFSKEQSDLYFKINVAYTFFQQKYGNLNILKGRKENRLTTDLDFHAYFNSTAGIGIAGYMKNYAYNVPVLPPPSINSGFILDNQKKYAGNYGYTTFSVNPYFTFEGDNWNARLGASANIQAGGIKDFLVSPDIRFYWMPAEKFRFYSLLTGGIKDNSNYVSYYENRYIDPAFRIYDSKSPFDAVLGFEFSVIPNTSLDLFAGYRWVNDEHFYITDAIPESVSGGTPLAGQGILPQYLDAQTFKLGGIFKYVYQDVFDLNLRLAYYQWNIDKFSDNINRYDSYSFSKPSAWNKPQWETDLNLAFQIPEIPFQLHLLYHGEWERKTFVFNEIRTLKDVHDLSFKGTYALSRAVSVYAVLNNLLFQKYEFLYGYPAQNFNIMGGISVKF
jgi:hypothetical protein